MSNDLARDYAGDLEDELAVQELLPPLDDPATAPPDEGDAGPAGVIDAATRMALQLGSGAHHPSAHVGPSGLHRPQRIIARDRGTQALLLGYHHRGAVHYTEGPARWEGIARHRIAAKGQYPTEADCSAYFSWAGWNAVEVPFNQADVFNADRWQGGFTGTLARCGREVLHLDRTLRMDAVLYGAGPDYDHVAGIIGHDTVDGRRIPIVCSHGSESGPLILPYNYRSDVAQIRRYI